MHSCAARIRHSSCAWVEGRGRNAGGQFTSALSPARHRHITRSHFLQLVASVSCSARSCVECHSRERVCVCVWQPLRTTCGWRRAWTAAPGHRRLRGWVKCVLHVASKHIDERRYTPSTPDMPHLDKCLCVLVRACMCVPSGLRCTVTRVGKCRRWLVVAMPTCGLVNRLIGTFLRLNAKITFENVKKKTT